MTKLNSNPLGLFFSHFQSVKISFKILMDINPNLGWVGFLGVRFDVCWGSGGKITLLPKIF